MKNFDFNRFGKAVKWTALANKRHLIRFTSVMTIAYLVVQMGPLLNNLFVTAPSEFAIMGVMGFCQVLFALSCLYCLTYIFQNIKTKQERIVFFTLPFSMPEKYLTRLIYCCVVMPVASYVGMLASTGVRLLLQFILHHADIYVGLVSPSLPFGCTFSGEMPVVALLTVLSVNLWIASVFVLGGSFFRKQPLVMTFATIFACFFLFGWFLSHFVQSIISLFTDFNGYFAAWLACAMFMAFAALNIWQSYRLFTRMQVVQHKWFNV